MAICSVCNVEILNEEDELWTGARLIHKFCQEGIEDEILENQKFGKEDLERELFLQEEKKKVEKIVLTTAFSVSNRDIDYEIEVITSECVYGMNIFRDAFASARNIFGGRSDATQKVLSDLRETCLHELKLLAFDKGADAVIAIDLDYSEFSGGMLFLVASGTAVKLKE